MLYPQRRILNKYRSTWFRSRSSLWENGQDDESQENFAILDATRPWTPIQACLSLSTVTLDGYFSAFASRVANAPRKLRYHQLCSPASLPTEWTQSGSLSSESSFRWSLSYVRSLTDRVMAYNRHTTIPKHLLVAISARLANVERCIVFAKRATWSPYRSSSIFARITLWLHEISKLILTIGGMRIVKCPITWMKRTLLYSFFHFNE